MANTGTTVYPGALDNYTNVGTATYEDDAGFSHVTLHNQVHEAIEAIEATLGTTSGTNAFIKNTGGTITNATTNTALLIDHNGATGIALNIDTESATSSGGGMKIAADVLTTGTGLWVTTDCETFTSADGLVELTVDNTSASGNVMRINQDGTGNGLFIDQDGNGRALSIDSEATDSYGIFCSVDALTTGIGLSISSGANIDATGALASFNLSGGSAAGKVIDVTNAGVGPGIYVGQTGVLGAGKHAVHIYSNTANQGGNLLCVDQDNATNTAALIQINNDGTGESILAESGAKLTAVGVWTDAPSYRKYKDKEGELESVLEKIEGLDVDVWKYKNKEIDGKNRYLADQTKHCSPYLDDFYNVFGLGSEDGVNPMDYVGVLFNAVKELTKRVKELEK